MRIRKHCERSLAGFSLGLSVLVLACPARAQSFDCAKAASPVERAICASSDLRAADDSLAGAFSRALASADVDAAARLRNTQRAWIADRNACGAQANGAQANGALADCVAKSYRARAVALSQAPAPSMTLPSGPTAGSASLSPTTVPGAGDHDVLLTVQKPGRFAIRAASKTGVALQLVDMIAGPGEIAGDARIRDGRLDVLLDEGVYKLRTFGATAAVGDAAITATPFTPIAAADSKLLRGGEWSGTLADFQQHSIWVFVGADKRLGVDAAGRALRDLRAWRNGTDLEDIKAVVASIEPKAGHALTRLRLDGTVEPGLYLVTAYGGPPLPWTDGDTAQPLHLRVGPPPFLPGGSVDATIGPSGTLQFTLPASARYVRVALPEVAPARLTIRHDKTILANDAIEKANREPVASASFSAGENVVAEISGMQGQRIYLRALAPASSLRASDAGLHVVGVDVAGDGGDEVPATAVLARFNKAGSAGQVIASNALRVAPGQAWRRRFNLRGATTLLVEIAGAGPVAARTQGVGARIALEPLLGTSAPRADGKRPRLWDVDAGFYTLKIDPAAGAVGILDLTFGQPDLAVDATPPSPPRETIDFGLITFERQSSYQLLLNTAPGLVTGPRMPALPAYLAAGPLTIVQPAKQAIVEPPSPPPVAPPAPMPPKPQRTEAPAVSPIVPKPVVTSRVTSNGVAARPATPPGAALPKPPAPVARSLPPKPAQMPAPQLPPSSLVGDKPLTIAVKTPADGTITVTDTSGRDVPFTKSAEIADRALRGSTLTIEPSEATRTLFVAWTKAIPNEPIPALPREGDEPKLTANTPRFFDLAQDDRKTFALDVAEGGLYRIETLGRLKTSATIGTRFLPKLGEADDNGDGHNALLQTWLRGGAYRVRVEAQESSGHLGLVARPARLLDGGTLIAEGSARATLADGAGVAFAIDIVEAGDYRLDLYGLDRTFTARLEDAEGWPLDTPGGLSTLRRRFDKGRYRLVVMPPDIDAQVVARLRRDMERKQPEGHGPHPLPFDATTSAQWREPASKDAARTADRWTFMLAGPARVTLTTSDGMTGDLLAEGTTVLVARIAKGRAFAGELGAGRYSLEMRALGRDDRLDYTLDLRSDAIQPGRARFVELPQTIPFAIAQDRVVSLTTFGDTQLKGVLRNAAGDAIERLSGRTDDWNLALSRRLPPGQYTLDLAALETPKDKSGDSGETTENADDPPAAKTAAAEDARTDDEDADAKERENVEVRLALPVASPPRNMSLSASDMGLSGTVLAQGTDVSRFSLPALDAGALLLVAAQADGEIVLSLERRDASGTRVAGFARGRAPVVAVPLDATMREGWDIAVWPVDGGPVATTIAARAFAMPAQTGSHAVLAPAGKDGPLARWRVGRLSSASRMLLTSPARADGMLAGSRPGRPLASFTTGLLAPQSDDLWFVSPAGSDQAIALENAVGGDFALTLDGGDVARLPAAAATAAAGRLRVWRADATDGQPGLVSDAGAAIAKGTAFALADDAPVRAWNAGTAEPLQMRIAAIDVVRAAPIDAGAAKAIAVPPKTAQPMRLGAGVKRLSLQLAPGVGAILSGDVAPQAIWAGDAATSRELTGAWTDALLVNTTDTSAPVGIESVPASAIAPLAAGGALKRFFGAGGALTMAIDGKAGDRLIVAGGAATFVGVDGRVARGASIPLAGPGNLTLDHPAGLVVAGIENGDMTPWAVPKAVATMLPKSLPMEGPSMALAIRADTPMLLRARTTAPVILAVRQGGEGDPEPMPLGADVRRYIAAGDAELRLFSPSDGPLTGTLDLSAQPVTPVGDGVGEAQVIAPGGTALFAFDVARPGSVGIGVRADPDRVAVKLLDAGGALLGEGVAQMRQLKTGRYLIEAHAPADGPTVTVRPAVVGLQLRPGGPPPDVAATYLELVGMTKAR